MDVSICGQVDTVTNGEVLGDVMVKKYRVELTVEEQEDLKALVSRGRVAAY